MTTQAPDAGFTDVVPVRISRLHLALDGALALPRARVIRIVVLGSIVGLIVVFYCWTVNTSGSPMVFGQPQNDYYNQLASSFLHGQLSLLMRPPAALVNLKNPYDPGQNIALAGPYHDLALYHGRFYLAWGPTAALVLFIPWRILHVGDASQSFAIVVFSSIGLFFAVRLMCHVVDRYLSRVRLWKLAVATLALGLCSVSPFLLRRPAQYEVAISSGYCFAFIALYLLVSGIYREQWSSWRVALGSFCVGLTILAREDLALLLIFPVLLAVREWNLAGRGFPHTQLLLRRALPLLLPALVMVIVVAWYNAARFGSPLQFGTRYQLASVDQENAFNYKLWAIPPGLYYYFVEPVQYTLAFPYFLIGPPPYYPWVVANYVQTEPVGGVLTMIPILLLNFVSPFIFRRRFGKDLPWMMIAAGVVGFLIALAIAWGIPGTTERYEVDFATLLMFPALFAWFALTDPTMAPWSGARFKKLFCSIASVLGTIFLVYGMLAGMGISITGYYDEMRQFDTNAYNQLEASTSGIPTLITKLMGHPDITKDVYLCGNGECGTYAAGLSHWTFDDGTTVELDVISPSGGWNLGLNLFATTTFRAGDKVEIQLDNHTWYVDTVKGQRWVAVPLHSGFNRIYYTVPGKNDVSFFKLTTTRSGRGLLPLR